MQEWERDITVLIVMNISDQTLQKKDLQEYNEMKECHQCKEPYNPTKQWYGCRCCDAIYCADCFLTLDPADE